MEIITKYYILLWYARVITVFDDSSFLKNAKASTKDETVAIYWKLMFSKQRQNKFCSIQINKLVMKLS